MSNAALLAQSNLQVKTTLTSLEEVLFWFEGIAFAFLPSDIFHQCQIALTEGFTNVVRHAHRTLPETTPIELEVRIFSPWIEIKIWDRGEPFDLEKTLESLIKWHADPLEHEGGRGLIFMSKLTDELHYIRLDDQRNCLVMKKQI
ncbi:MAG: ATP-binding protein [Planktothrix sp. GU0601_MAG3]|nr:MAG: ATP-binding protein [Planktothrix sp. GU0601_MAG3]